MQWMTRGILRVKALDVRCKLLGDINSGRPIRNCKYRVPPREVSGMDGDVHEMGNPSLEHKAIFKRLFRINGMRYRRRQ